MVLLDGLEEKLLHRHAPVSYGLSNCWYVSTGPINLIINYKAADMASLVITSHQMLTPLRQPGGRKQCLLFLWQQMSLTAGKIWLGLLTGLIGTNIFSLAYIIVRIATDRYSRGW
jgi:hypothetical protein